MYNVHCCEWKINLPSSHNWWPFWIRCTTPPLCALLCTIDTTTNHHVFALHILYPIIENSILYRFSLCCWYTCTTQITSQIVYRLIIIIIRITMRKITCKQQETIWEKHPGNMIINLCYKIEITCFLYLVFLFHILCVLLLAATTSLLIDTLTHTHMANI